MNQLNVQHRWMLKRDMDEVLWIERTQFEFPLTSEELLAFLRKKNNIGMVAESGDEIVGHCLYGLQRDCIHIASLAVAPGLCRQGIGRQMIERLKDKLGNHRRSSLMAIVRERNVDAQLFLRSMEFDWTETIRSQYSGCADDAYAFMFRR